MQYTRIALLAVGLLYGASDFASAHTINFTLTDVPGRWFDTGVSIAGTRSLAIAAPGDTVTFQQDVESKHTVTSLIWPSTALASEKIDQDTANIATHSVNLDTPGLYVFVCKLHPYMLGGVIVDAPGTAGLDLGEQITLLGVGSFDSNSNLGLRLLRALFVVTNPANWKDYTKVGTTYLPDYPDVDVRVTGGAVVNLKTTLQGAFDGDVIPAQVKPAIRGVGEVWVDTAYELSAQKGDAYPGAMTVVKVGAALPANNWKVTRKIALPSQLMNNGHNMWASHNQNVIYETEWHGRSLFVVNRVTGAFLKEIVVGDDPAHVMTRVDTGQVHVTLNGDDYVVELNKVPAPEYLRINRYISMQNPNSPTKPTQPHAHWMGFDGKSMATPNANSNDSTLYDFNQNLVVAKTPVGALPIAVGMMPDSSKYYVSNYLGHSLSVMDGATGANTGTINLLGDYDPVTGLCGVVPNQIPCVNIGALPIQTPVSPDGKFVITGNTLTATITIVSTTTDTVVKTIGCDPGCHGVNFGAKKGGGYYAYVTSKFANRLIVLDYDPNNDGDAADAVVAGWVVLANDTAPRDAFLYANLGMGGQGVLPIPIVYNGWVQKLPATWKLQLTPAQRNPFPIVP